MLEQLLIRHCSPTLSNMKTGNLFRFICSDKIYLQNQLTHINRQLNKKGVTIYLIKQSQSDCLLYVCRLSKLEKDLQKPGIAKFLASAGYQNISPSACVEKLKQRFSSSNGFPHEIGLFLGYPLADVKGFIENSGQKFLFSGHWKVYSNGSEADKIFAKFNKCKTIYQKLYENQLRSISQLTVAA